MRVICVGPMPEPITGQAVAFRAFVNNSEHQVDIIDNNFMNRGIICKIYLSVICLIKFVKAICTNKFDALYITTSRSLMGFLFDAISICLFKIFSQGRVINHLHGADFRLFRDSSRVKMLIDFVYNRIDSSIVLSPKMKEQYQCYANMKLFTVPNFSEVSISTEELDNKAKSFEKSKKIRVLYLSNLMYTKGIFHLVKSVSSLKALGYDFELHVAGAYVSDDVMSAKELENLTRDFFVDGIYFHGVVKGDKKEELLKKCNLFCLPTFYPTEAQPISIIEALSYGCLVLTTYHNYNQDFLTNNDAIFFDSDSIKQLNNTLSDLYDNRHIYSRHIYSGYRKAMSDFTLDNYVRSIDTILEAKK